MFALNAMTFMFWQLNCVRSFVFRDNPQERFSLNLNA